MAGETSQYTIQVNVVGDKALKSFQTSIDRMNKSATASQKALTKMDKQMTAVGNSARRLVPILASLFSVQQVRNIVAYGDAIAKTADKVGLSTDSLQELRYAAELSGVPIRTLDMAMQRFARRAGEATQGTGELAKVFEELGISTTDAAGNVKSTEELLYEYADAVANAGSQQEKLRLAFKAFDAEGAALVNLIGQGSEAMKEMATDANKLGIVISEDLVRGAEDFNDMITKMSLALKGLFATTVLTAMKSFSEGMQSFVADLKAGEAAAGVLAGIMAGALLGAITKVTLALKALALSNPWTALAVAAVTAATLIIANWDKVIAFFKFQIPRALYYVQGIWFEVLGSLTDAVDSLLTGVSDKFSSLSEKVKELASAAGIEFVDRDQFNKLERGLDGYIAKLEEGTAATESYGDKARASYEKAHQYAEQYYTAVSGGADATKAGAAAQEQMNKATAGAAQSQNAAAQAAQKQAAAQEAAKNSLDNYTKSLIATQRELDLLPQKVQAVIQLYEQGAISAGVMEQALESLGVATKRSATWQQEYAASLKKTQEESNRTAEKVRIVSQMLEQGAISSKTAAEAMKALGVEVNNTQGIFEGFGQAVVNILSQQVTNAAKEMVGILFQSGKSVGEIVTGMVKQFARLVAEMLAAKAAAAALNAVLGGLGGGGGGGGIGGVIGGIASKIPVVGPILGGIGSLLPFARGGVFPAGIAGRGFITNGPMRFRGFGPGMLYPAANGMVIGEAGREAVLPLTKTRSGNLGVEASGGAVNVSVHNYAGADVRVKNTSRADGGRDIEFLINDAVKKEFKRGGYDRALKGNFNVRRRGM